jgi:hypothetical protein
VRSRGRKGSGGVWSRTTTRLVNAVRWSWTQGGCHSPAQCGLEQAGVGLRRVGNDPRKWIAPPCRPRTTTRYGRACGSRSARRLYHSRPSSPEPSDIPPPRSLMHNAELRCPLMTTTAAALLGPSLLSSRRLWSIPSSQRRSSRTWGPTRGPSVRRFPTIRALDALTLTKPGGAGGRPSFLRFSDGPPMSRDDGP